MSKLFVYGCSFSMGFNDFQRKKDPIYSWPFLLSNYLKHPLVLRSWAGYGWNQIKTFIDNDLLGYTTNHEHPKKGPEFYPEKLSTKDILIISPSYFDRIRFPELNYDEDTQVHVVAKYGQSIDKMARIQFVSFKAKINLLNKAGFRTLGWPWLGYGEGMNDYSDCPFIIPTPDGGYSFQKWMEKNPQYNLIPGDTHFNEAGHEFIAEYFFNYIRDGKTLDLWR